ncbi:LOW QUALITY PROTEIN: uncharacterized protein LOC123506059 [Portunus trituberculatus]|uniref:LOW QUALITY PROTEIN: uncharacterized protein LOC123506059 n=1 Tax=Portunus trituberculatus TaxID=210409 RepID=UPI001E1CDE3B|nr:LOW QUALITY PROTEIN: uncharacterized protein LOC123506059 [Portunus trituberculatus]
MAASSAAAAPVPAPYTATAMTQEDYSRFKLVYILMGPGTAVLCHALKCGTNKAPSTTLLDHLNSLQDSSTANYCSLNDKTKKKIFTKDEERKISNDPSCQSFDITLLYKSITLACEGVADLNDARWQDPSVMEGLLHKIKEERNACVHEWSQITMDEHQLKNKLQDLESLFLRALQAVKNRYGYRAETNTLMDNVKMQVNEVLQAFTDKVILQMNFEKKLDLFKEVSAYHLKDLYKNFECFDPLSFLFGPEERVHIQFVFKLLLQQEHSKSKIDCLEVLKVLREKCRPSLPAHDDRPRLAVVSGIAGSGKTTLLTFLVSEWRREECDRRVTCLEEYDIVLRILCRDTDAEDLETFLGLVLPPSLSVFGEPLVKYLGRCKVLFLIDGLDEMNDTSEKLVTNVLTIAKYNKCLSVLVSSRPERVDWLVRRYKKDYHISHLSLEGIPVTKRIEFALQYSTSSTNHDRLREFMTQQENTKLFELPLNLVFLVRLFEEKQDCIKENITQASLYTHFHEWCTEKLHDRISTHPTWGEKSPLTLKTRIRRVVEDMYQMALQGLRQDKLSLSEEDTERLEKSCRREDLPPREVLGAFFTLRLSVNNRVREQHYSMPHKGLLEYFAARHIMKCLQDESLPTTQPWTFHADLNLFFLVAGLLAKQYVPNHQKTMKVVIKQVEEIGAGWFEWLSLVEHTDYDESFLHAIAHHVTDYPLPDSLEIGDSELASAAALLPLTPLKTLKFDLCNKSVNIDNVRALSPLHCSGLFLRHHYKHPGDTPASDTVLQAIHRSCLNEFYGHLSADCLALLPECLWRLSLAVSSFEHATRLAAGLTRAASSLSNLTRLDIHIPMSMVTPAAVMSPLPDFGNVRLLLSDVDENLVKEACQVAVALQPRTGYQTIGFPRGRMEAAQWRRLLHLMKDEGITVGRRVEVRGGWRVHGCVRIPEEAFTMEDHSELNHLTDTLWGCNVLSRRDEFCF